MRLDVVLNLFFELFGGFGALYQHYAGLDDLTANFVRSSADAAFQNVRQLHEDAFDLEGSDAVA